MKGLISAAILILLSATSAFAFNFITPEEFKSALEEGKPVIILDIQPEDGFSKQHFKGSIETNA
jgi:hypothetical protein